MSERPSWSEHFGGEDPPDQGDAKHRGQPGRATKAIIGLSVAVAKVALTGTCFYLGLMAVDALFPVTLQHGFSQYLWCALLGFALMLGRATVQAGISEDS